MDQLLLLSRRTLLLPLLIVALLTASTLPSHTHAAVIDTQSYLDHRNGSALSDIEQFLAREDVVAQFDILGVDPQTARKRLAGLTDGELGRLQETVRNAPAGSDALAVLGIVLVVLIVLEILGVTNVFTRL